MGLCPAPLVGRAIAMIIIGIIETILRPKEQTSDGEQYR